MFHTDVQQLASGHGAAGDADLADADRRFHSLLRSISGIFYRCELFSPWTMSFISEGVEALTGYRDDELTEGWAALMLPEDRPAVEAAIGEAMAAGRRFDVEYRITHKAGSTRWVSERGHAVYDPGNRPLFLEGVITDISARKEAEERDRVAAIRLCHMLNSIPQMVWSMNADGSDPFYNSQWFEFVGGDPDDHRHRVDLLHPEDRERVEATWTAHLASGTSFECQYRLLHVRHGFRWVLARGQAATDPTSGSVRWYGTCSDIHEQVVAKNALQASEALNRSMIEATPDALSLIDGNGRITFLNGAAVAALGLPSPHALTGHNWLGLFPTSVRTAAAAALAQAQNGGAAHFTVAQQDGVERRWWDVLLAPIKAERGGGILSIARDISHQKTAEERVRWAANHDALTRLPNRALFQFTLDRQLAEAEATRTGLAVLMLDLDNFKRTNDALGHDAGDALLVEFAQRLRRAVRGDELVARLGGDEFALLLRNVDGADAIEQVVDAIGRELELPFEYDGKLLDIRTSIGASLYPIHGSSRAELLKHADIALYGAKAAGRGVLRVFAPAMRAEAQNRMSMLSLAKDALAQDRILPFYQPKFDLRTGRLAGFEALLRWHHPSFGIQLPGTVEAAFQDVTLAAAISERMLDAVIRDLRRWRDEGVAFNHVAVNAAAAEFRNGDFAERLLERLRRAGLPPSCLQLEVTETVFLGRGAEHVADSLRRLAAAGIIIALDDFGTGYASLSHLNQFPVHVLKIDGSFVRNLGKSAHDTAIVRAVINLGRSLGSSVVGEGVETQAQLDQLRRLRCHYGQGYLFGKAGPADAVPDLIREWRRHSPARRPATS